MASVSQKAPSFFEGKVELAYETSIVRMIKVEARNNYTCAREEFLLFTNTHLDKSDFTFVRTKTKMINHHIDCARLWKKATFEVENLCPLEELAEMAKKYPNLKIEYSSSLSGSF